MPVAICPRYSHPQFCRTFHDFRLTFLHRTFRSLAEMIPISGAKSGDLYTVSAEAAPSFNGFVGITGITFDSTP